ncbi:unnamed protein product, partial [Ectocarpus sp. 12 AP-2014]
PESDRGGGGGGCTRHSCMAEEAFAGRRPISQPFRKGDGARRGFAHKRLVGVGDRGRRVEWEPAYDGTMRDSRAIPRWPNQTRPPTSSSTTKNKHISRHHTSIHLIHSLPSS